MGDDPKVTVMRANIYTSRIRDFRRRKKRMDEYVKSVTLSDDESDTVASVDSKKEPARTLRSSANPHIDVTTLPVVPEREPLEDWIPPPPETRKTMPKRGKQNTKNRKRTTKILRELEVAKSQFSENALSMDDCDDIEFVDEINANPDRDIVVKMRWQGIIHRIPMKLTQKFQTILPNVASMCGALPSEILLSLNDTNVQLEDTPASLQFTMADILDCGVLKSGSMVGNDEVSSESDSRMISLKVQALDRKNKMEIKINKLDPLSILMEKYAQKQDLDLERLAFMFDGDRLDPESTPLDLDMEDGDCVDVRITK